MKYIISDIFIGDFPVTQYFGQNPASYARFGINGHDGIDFGCPKGTKVVAAHDGVALVAYDATGYGKYAKVVSPAGYLTIYGHLDQQIVTNGKTVVKGELLGYSGNTGNVYPAPTADNPNNGSHLHFGLAPCDAVGNKTEASNGFAGYIDPNGDRCAWQLVNLQAPIDPNPPAKPVYEAGGWYDNPATGKNQRWWPGDIWTDGEDPTVPAPPVVAAVVPPAPLPPNATESETITNLNDQIKTYKDQLLAAIQQGTFQEGRASHLQTTAESLQTEVNMLTEQKRQMKVQLDQALNDRDVCLAAQGNQSRLMTVYKNASVEATDAGKLILAGIIKLFTRGGGKKNGTSTSKSGGSSASQANP